MLSKKNSLSFRDSHGHAMDDQQHQMYAAPDEPIEMTRTSSRSSQYVSSASEDEGAASERDQHDRPLLPSSLEKNTNEHERKNEHEDEEDVQSGRKNPSPPLEEHQYEFAVGSSMVSVSEAGSAGDERMAAAPVPNESSPLLGLAAGSEGSHHQSQQPTRRPPPARQPYYDSYLGDATPIINNLSAFLQPGYSWRDDVAFFQHHDGGGGQYESDNSGEGGAGGLVRSIFGGMTGRRSSFNKQQQQGHHRRRRDSRRREDGVTDTLDRLEELGVVTHSNSPTKQRNEEREQGLGQLSSSSSVHHDPSTFPSLVRRLSSSRHHNHTHQTHWKKNYFLTFVLVFSCVGSMFVLTVSGPDHTNSAITFGGGGRNVVVASSPTTDDEEGGSERDGEASTNDGRRRHGNHRAGGPSSSSYYRQYRRYYTQGGAGAGGGDWLMSEEPVDAQQREVVPTLLGIVYPDTYDSVDAIDNWLYDEMAEAEYIGSISDIRPSTATANTRRGGGRGQSRSRLPTLTVDRTAVTFHHSLTLSWEDGTDVRVRDDDVIALYCPASQDDPRNFRDAATIEQIVATGGYEWDGKEEDDDDDDDDFSVTSILETRTIGPKVIEEVKRKRKV